MQPVSWSADLHELAQRHGERIAVRGADAQLSYAALSARSHALAQALGSSGIAPGDSVAWSLPNGPEAAWASYGITLHGAAETPMAPSLTADEVAWFAGLAGTRWVVTQAARRDFFTALGMQVIAVEDVGADGPSPLAAVPGAIRGKLIATSGTTGKPKVVVYSHAKRAVGHALLQSVLPFRPGAGDAILLMTPYSHGAGALGYAWFDHGSEVVLLDGVHRAQVGGALRGGMAAVFAPPTVINKLAELFPDERFAGVRCVFTGTQTLTQATYRRAERMFGPVVRVTYGKSECVNPITVLAPTETAAHYASEATPEGACLGLPAKGVELRILDGEIWLRATQMADGVIDASGFHAFEGGWHATGDMGWIDGRGRLWLSGRAADIIKSGGYKVQPDEIEAVLAGIPGCGQIVVAALPSDYWGEVIVAATEQAGADWHAQARARVESLSKHKRPRAYVELAALPRNAQGKVSRKAVRAEILSLYSLVDGPRPELKARP